MSTSSEYVPPLHLDLICRKFKCEHFVSHYNSISCTLCRFGQEDGNHITLDPMIIQLLGNCPHKNYMYKVNKLSKL